MVWFPTEFTIKCDENNNNKKNQQQQQTAVCLSLTLKPVRIFLFFFIITFFYLVSYIPLAIVFCFFTLFIFFIFPNRFVYMYVTHHIAMYNRARRCTQIHILVHQQSHFHSVTITEIKFVSSKRKTETFYRTQVRTRMVREREIVWSLLGLEPRNVHSDRFLLNGKNVFFASWLKT
jgi:hypothetical protein